MIKLVIHTEKNDTVFHTEKTGMWRLVVEIDVVGMTADVVDKLTCSFDDWQLKQVDMKCVQALTEPHFHDIHVVPNRHEVDQRVVIFGGSGKNVKFLGVNIRNVKFGVTSVSAGGSSLQFDAPFPADYEQLLDQEIEFPTAGLDSVLGDGEGGIEMTGRVNIRNVKFGVTSVSAGGSSLQFDAPFPADYEQLLDQAKDATQTALDDGIQLMEIEFPTAGLDSVLGDGEGGIEMTGRVNRRIVKFGVTSVSAGGSSLQFDAPFPADYEQLLDQEIEFPTAGLDSVPGDGEGGIEMTGSMQLIREFCDLLILPEKATRTRIFFPEANEVQFARKSVFGGASFKLDYLTKPSFFQDFGFVEAVKMVDRVKEEDELFIVGYPYFNVNEMLVVEELYRDAVAATARQMIIFNGELDRIRSGYYPSFFYPKLAALSKTLFPQMETVYYIHNFKGRNGGILFSVFPFRFLNDDYKFATKDFHGLKVDQLLQIMYLMHWCYPGPWKVLRRLGSRYVCLHQQETMPTLKEVALDILPSA
nr:protein low PSII accumulation 3, chloroplastic [Tanacetum cinerariifolium]